MNRTRSRKRFWRRLSITAVLLLVAAGLFLFAPVHLAATAPSHPAANYAVALTRVEALQAELRDHRAARAKALEEAKKRAASATEVRNLEAKFKAAEDGLTKRIAAIRASYASLEDKVGVFEGAGYASKGLYRSMIYCIMIGSPKNEFCRVCQAAIARMIDFTARGF